MKNHAAIVVRNGNKFLFVQRATTKKSLPNIWAFPSGTIEEGESAEITVVREAREELGIDVVVEKLLTVIDLPELGARLQCVVCAPIDHKAIIFDPEEIQAVRWMTFADFFIAYSDEQIGHGLIYLRKHPEIWKEYI